MNYEAERLILIGMLELACEQQLAAGVRPTLTAAIGCLKGFPLDPLCHDTLVALTALSCYLTPEALERTHAGTAHAIRLQHDRLVSAILR